MRFRLLSLLLIAAVLIIGCTAQEAVVATQPAAMADGENVAAAPHTEVLEPMETEETALPADAPTPTSLPEAVAISDEPAEACPNRAGLEATDPATVALASGDVQLVEFFAFW